MAQIILDVCPPGHTCTVTVLTRRYDTRVQLHGTRVGPNRVHVYGTCYKRLKNRYFCRADYHSFSSSHSSSPHTFAMEALGVAARLSNLNAHDFVDIISTHIVDPVFPSNGTITLFRRFCVTWLFLYSCSLVVYFFFASLDYIIFFKLLKHNLSPGHLERTEVFREISLSVRSLSIMAAMSTPVEVAVQLGHGKVYYDPSQYGYLYLIVSPFLFLAFSDFLIYFIHRGLHHPLIYKHVHKAHHSFIQTTPFAAFAFHPLDGYLQGTPYQIFVFILPFHSAIHLLSLVVVSMWTINIHDTITFNIPGINGAAHHTIHHTTFRSNYGQYTTLWDKLGGTFKDPQLWKKSGSPSLSEKEAYGKDA